MRHQGCTDFEKILSFYSIQGRILFTVQLADQLLLDYAAGSLHLMLLITPTDVPFLQGAGDRPAHVVYQQRDFTALPTEMVEFDLSHIYQGLGRHRLTLVGYHWLYDSEEDGMQSPRPPSSPSSPTIRSMEFF
jgi:hypothetical protein